MGRLNKNRVFEELTAVENYETYNVVENASVG